MKAKLLDLIKTYEALNQKDIDDFYNNNDKFNAGFIINMASRTERLAKSIQNLNKIKLKYRKFVALNGKNLIKDSIRDSKNDSSNTTNSNDLSSLVKMFSILRPGEFGCVLSHLSIIAMAANHPNQNNFTVIFEDDIVTNGGDIQKLYKELEELDKNENIGLIYFGKCFEKCGQMINIKDNIYRAVAPSCCHSYAIKNSFASTLFNDISLSSFTAQNNSGKLGLNANYFNRGIDSILGDYIINGLTNGLVLHPAIFYQDVLDGGSDLRLQYMQNYQECNDTMQTQDTNNNTLFIVIIVILAIIVLIMIIIQMGPKITNNKTFIGAFFIFVLILLIIAAAVYFSQSSNNDINFEKEVRLPSLTKTLNIEPKLLPLDKTKLATKSYRLFNPNGFININMNVNNNNNLPSGVGIVMRCSNDKNSYPVLQIHDPKNMNKILHSKIIQLNSDLPIVDLSTPLGFEDMRLLQVVGNKDQAKLDHHYYLIGVNLDRNPLKLPSMVLVKLDHNFNQESLLHLSHDDYKNVPNKNWMPMMIKNKTKYELHFLVNIDPLLIVKPDITGKCHDVFKAPLNSPQQPIEKIRNSTIPIHSSNIPPKFKQIISNKSFGDKSPSNYWILFGHTKHFVKKFVCYKHYFIIINNLNLGDKSPKQELPVMTNLIVSKPFSMENELNPHVEYISGFNFTNDNTSSNSKMVIMYGLNDKFAKYVEITAEQFDQILFN